MKESHPAAYANSILPTHLRDFLKRKGWQEQEHRNKSLLVMRGSFSTTSQYFSIVVPNSSEMADYEARLRDALTVISEGLSQDVSTIVDTILHWNRDVYKIRLQSPSNKEQLLSVDEAAKVIPKYRDFIAFAAATEITPRRFFAKLTEAGHEFAEHCLFGHTFIGSFGITIECPLHLPPDRPLPNVPPPRLFNRAVTERIAAGFLSMKEAVKTDDPEVIVKSYLKGFSGNMCELLADIYEFLGEREVIQNIIWSPELAPDPELVAASKDIALDQKSYEVLKSASAMLQKVDEPDEDKTIVGRITKLRSERPPITADEVTDEKPTVVIRWEMEKRQPLHINVILPIDQYRAACDAHKNGRKMRIIGKPEKRGKLWYLKEQHGFEII